ncbi:MAG: TetR family transcriptional regulator [Actinomycetota bacterium]|nr:TetR family transcriptional regulator [Actinomycetota bacterium]
MSTITATSPGRSEHGAERRAAILAATVRLLSRDGLAAITHRAVAREAGVPLAATTYYFSSKEELLTDALGVLVADEVAMLRGRAAELGDTISSSREFARELARALTPQTDEEVRVLVAKFEVYLEAARNPALREQVAEWVATYNGLAEAALEVAGAPDPRAAAPLLVAGVDGLLAQALTRGIDALDEAEIRDQFQLLITALTARP